MCKLPESRDTFYFRSCSPHLNTLSRGDNSFRSNSKTGCSKIAEHYTLLLRSQKSHTNYMRKLEIHLEWMECESGLQWESGKVSFFLLEWDFKPFILFPSIGLERSWKAVCDLSYSTTAYSNATWVAEHRNTHFPNQGPTPKKMPLHLFKAPWFICRPICQMRFLRHGQIVVTS